MKLPWIVKDVNAKKLSLLVDYLLATHRQGFHNEQWGQGWNCDGDAGQSCGMGLWGQYAVRRGWTWKEMLVIVCASCLGERGVLSITRSSRPV